MRFMGITVERLTAQEAVCMTFSPFTDDQGNPKDLASVTFADLAQLADMDEGYVLEFKQSLTAGVKRKIPKIIASFANSRGGWLVIGIADDDHAVCPVPRLSADYSQLIGELCRRHVSPAPPFDVRFIADPDAPDQGVVVVRVDEGRFPPYVADGVVEIREGSTSGPAAGSALVELYDKATRRAAQITDFCRRTVYFSSTVPLFDLYLFRTGSTRETSSREVINARADAMRRAFGAQGFSCHIQHAHDSLIFRASVAFADMMPHSAIELFPDESMKLTVPAVLLEGKEREGALAELDTACGLAATDKIDVMSAASTLARVTRMASVLDRYVRYREARWREYATAYELENMAGVLLWSDELLYIDYVRSHGPLFCGTTDCRSRVRYLDDGEHDSFRARQFAGSHFFEACGLPLGSPDDDDNRLVDALLRTERGARRERA